jgi:hypothetical protein
MGSCVEQVSGNLTYGSLHEVKLGPLKQYSMQLTQFPVLELSNVCCHIGHVQLCYT